MPVRNRGSRTLFSQEEVQCQFSNLAVASSDVELGSLKKLFNPFFLTCLTPGP